MILEILRDPIMVTLYCITSIFLLWALFEVIKDLLE